MQFIQLLPLICNLVKLTKAMLALILYHGNCYSFHRVNINGSSNLVRGWDIMIKWSSKQKQQCKNQKFPSGSHYAFLRHLQ